MLKIYIFFLIIIFFNACSKEEAKILTIKEKKQDLEMISAYKDAYISLEQGDPYFAAKKFLEAELIYPQSDWAPKSALLASYSYYLQNFYPETISNLERYLEVYPFDKNHSYAHYLIAMCYFETIEDEKRDSGSLFKARDKFTYVVENFPNSDFAIDSKFKIDLIEDIIAAKEMYLGRHYIKKQKWIPAINRFKIVIEEYESTIFVEEALHRLVEINYKIGLKDESNKYAKLLGYNYLSSEWYKKSYKVFNKNYEISNKKINNKDKRGIIKKFKKLFD
jgi:outer membrane protein assembly factor BamD